MTPSTIGLDVGGTKILGVRADASGAVLAEAEAESPEGLGPIVAALAEMARRLDPADGPVPVGVGIAGLVDADGRLSYAPNLPTLVDVPVRAALADALGRECVVDNDATVATLAEGVHGAGAGCRDMLMVTLGTGIGGGILAGGRIYRGANGYAGEFGHITVDRDGPRCACGQRGHWESIASGTALGRMGRERVAAGRGAEILAQAGDDPEAVSGIDVEEAALAGDPEAAAVLEEFADNVAIGLASLAAIFDPEVIVISGGLVRMGPLLFEPLDVAFLRRLAGAELRPRISIRPAALGHRAGAVGAAVLARELRA